MSFADKGIKQSGRTKDGKKFFDVKETRLMDILNVPITVVDFETNVKTKQGEVDIVFFLNRTDNVANT